MKRKDFTLIELLVVIAIIAILASMLLPALQQARERGRAAKCISNMKTIAYAFTAYADEFKNYIPPYGNAIKVGDNGKVSSAGLHWYSCYKKAESLAHYINCVTDSSIALGGWGNVKGRLVANKYACPSKDVQVTWVTSGNDIPGIGINTYLSWNVTEKPTPIHASRYPSRNMVTMEKYKTGFIVRYDHNIQTGGNKTYAADYPHSDKNTIIFLDGHVAQLKRSAIPDQKLRPSGGKQTEAAYTTFWSPFRLKVANDW